MFHCGRTTAIILGFIAISAQSAAARAQEPSRLSVGVGMGIAAPLSGDFGFTATTFDASVRFGVAAHLMVEGAFSGWSHTQSTVMSNVVLQNGGGVIGHIGAVSEQTQRTGQIAQLNVLGRFTTGRLEVFAGGGGGVFTLSRNYRQTLPGCTSSIAAACQDSSSQFSANSFAGQVVGGGDVHVTGRLSAFGQLRFSVPVVDVGSGDVRVVAGVRVSVW